MDGWAKQRWKQLRIRHKILTVLLVLSASLAAGLTIHLHFLQQQLGLQHLRHNLILADSKVNLLRRLAVDIEDGFRGYILTQEGAFLTLLSEAEKKLDQALQEAKHALEAVSESSESVIQIAGQLEDLLRSEHKLIADIQRGKTENALAYVRSGEGLRLSDGVRHDLQAIEDRLDHRRAALNELTNGLSRRTFVGLSFVLGSVVLLGCLGSWTAMAR